MKLFRFFQLTALALIILLSSSCFDVREEFYIKKDGSGSAKIEMDISKMMEMFQMFSALSDSADTDGENPMEALDEAFQDNSTIENLSSIAGISNIRSLSNKDKAIIGYSFDFASIDVLNKAMGSNTSDMALASAMGLGEETASPEENMNAFEQKGKKFMRTHAIDKTVEDRMENEDEEDESGLGSNEMANMMFAEATYTIKYTFEKGVKKCKHPNARISPDGKSVVIENNMKDLLMGDAKLSSTIKTR